jgi:hypothetical protein
MTGTVMTGTAPVTITSTVPFITRSTPGITFITLIAAAITTIIIVILKILLLNPSYDLQILTWQVIKMATITTAIQTGTSLSTGITTVTITIPTTIILPMVLERPSGLFLNPTITTTEVPGIIPHPPERIHRPTTLPAVLPAAVPGDHPGAAVVVSQGR